MFLAPCVATPQLFYFTSSSVIWYRRYLGDSLVRVRALAASAGVWPTEKNGWSTETEATWKRKPNISVIALKLKWHWCRPSVSIVLLCCSMEIGCWFIVAATCHLAYTRKVIYSAANKRPAMTAIWIDSYCVVFRSVGWRLPSAIL